MPDSVDKPRRAFITRWSIDYFHNALGYPLAAAIVSVVGTAAVAFFAQKSWLVTAVMILAILYVASLTIGAFSYIRISRLLSNLRKWAGLTEVTDLSEFEQRNAESSYMPAKILARSDLRDLAVMGNGCSKWTMYVSDDEAITQFRVIRKKNSGAIRFLASCPLALSERNGTPSEVTWMKQKAVHNARSLIQLRDFKKRSEASGGRFEIKTYKHLATLRLIVVNESECIVGHYKEDGTGQSFDTPLLVFKCTSENIWGFGHAFRRLFDHEWGRAEEPTTEEWKAIEFLASQRQDLPVLGYPI